MTNLITKLINKNEYSRPGYKLVGVRGLVLHWTANLGGTAQNHQTFFGNGGGGRYAGAHIFIDKIQALLIVPLDEVAYHANEKSCKIQKLKATSTIGGKVRQWDANLTTIGIEMCVEKDGTIHPDTIARTVKVTAELMKKFNLTVNDLYRHYDITTKSCPQPWVKAPAEWTRFKQDVQKELAPAPTPAPTAPTQNASNNIGFVLILDPSLNIRQDASFTSKVVGTTSTGMFYKVYELRNGLYKIGTNAWVSANSKYVKYIAAGNAIGVATLKKWTPSTDTLNVRTAPDMKASVRGTLKQGTSWKVYDFTQDWLNVGKDMWISRNKKYVDVKFG